MRKIIFQILYKPLVYDAIASGYVDLCDKDNEPLMCDLNSDYQFWKYVCGSDNDDIIVESALPYNLYKITRMALYMRWSTASACDSAEKQSNDL